METTTHDFDPSHSPEQSNPMVSTIFVIDVIRETSSKQGDLLVPNLTQYTMHIEELEDDIPILGFHNHEKVYGFRYPTVQGIELTILLGGGKDGRNANVYFVIVLCGSVFNNILRKPFLTTLNIMAFPVHLKMKYHIGDGRPITVTTDLHDTTHIHNTILR